MNQEWPFDRGVHANEQDFQRGISEISSLKVGQELRNQHGDQFVILQKLGAGGMGSVFKVGDVRTGMIRAIKFMQDEVSQDWSYVKRFEREIRVLSQLHNPFILQPQDVAQFKVGHSDKIGLVTEYVAGTSLEQALREKGKFEPREIVTIAAELAYGLEGLRQVGIVHRDLKPGNVFLQRMPDAESVVRIGDFGLAGFASEFDQPTVQDAHKRTVSAHPPVTEPNMLIGTLEYLSPEAVEGKSVDHRSDLYALGHLLYELTTGMTPFSGDTEEVYRGIVFQKPPSMKEHSILIPHWLQKIIFKLLEKKPKDRYQTAAEVFYELKAVVKKHYPDLLQEIPFIWDVGAAESSQAHESVVA